MNMTLAEGLEFLKESYRLKALADLNRSLFADDGSYPIAPPMTDEQRRITRRENIKALIGVKLPCDEYDY